MAVRRNQMWVMREINPQLRVVAFERIDFYAESLEEPTKTAYPRGYVVIEPRAI
jgi:hypothetical protein